MPREYYNKNNRFIMNRFAIAITTSLLVLSCQKNDNKIEQPNILFIMTDDHALSAISAYDGYLSKVAPTPNIDRIANEGVLFNNFFCTNSISGPSRACILTGKYGHINGFYKNEDGGDFDGSQQTFPKLLQSAGYETAVIGKWHLGSSPTGFDYYKVLYNKEGQGSYYDPVFEVSGGNLIKEKGKYSTTVIKEDAINWLKNRTNKTKPFMLMYQFKAPHRPCDPDSAYMYYLKDVELPYPETYNDNYEGRLMAADAWNKLDGNTTRKDMKIAPPKDLSEEELIKWNDYGNNKGEFWTPDENMTDSERKNWKFQTYVKDYLRCVKAVDDAIGEMLDYLDKSGLAENTIVIYTSDQGFYLGEHGGWFDKRFMYEESFHMPCIMRYPLKIKGNKKIDEMLLNIDFAPTLLEYAGVEIPKDIQGKSFVSLLSDNDKKYIKRDAIYYHYYEYPFWHHVQPHYGIRTERYKLIHYYYNVDIWELYDLKNDPLEILNIYELMESSKLVFDLKKKLKELQKEFQMTKSLDNLRDMTDVKIQRSYVKEPAN